MFNVYPNLEYVDNILQNADIVDELIISYDTMVKPHVDGKDPHNMRIAILLSDKPVMFYCSGKFEIMYKNNVVFFDCHEEHAVFSRTQQIMKFKILRLKINNECYVAPLK